MSAHSFPKLTSGVLAFLLTIFFVGAAVAPAEEGIAADQSGRVVLLA